jgi:hypothetical protein
MNDDDDNNNNIYQKIVSNHEAHKCDFFDIICCIESSDIYNEILSNVHMHLRKILIFLKSY